MTDSRFCTNCGRQCDKGTFCGACGSPLLEPIAVASGAAKPTTGDEAAPPAASGAPPQVELAEPPEPPPIAMAPYEPPGQARPSPMPAARWRPFAIAGAAVFLSATLVAVLLIVLTGSSAGPPTAKAPKVTAKDAALAAQNLYTQIKRESYYVLLPAGWVKASVPQEPKLSDAIAVKSAQDEQQTIAVGELGSASGKLTTAARDVQRGLTAGVEPEYSAAISFPGGRHAYRFEWASSGRTGAAYLVDGCVHRFLIRGSAPTTMFATLKERLGIVAAGVQATQC